MGMSPRMYASASFYAGILTDEKVDALNNELDEAGFLVAHEGDDQGVCGNYTEGYVTVFTLLTNGWGDSISAEEFKKAYDIFITQVTDFCVAHPRCKLPTFDLGATYW